jgi:hypothetical protein
VTAFVEVLAFIVNAELSRIRLGLIEVTYAVLEVESVESCSLWMVVYMEGALRLSETRCLARFAHAPKLPETR